MKTLRILLAAAIAISLAACQVPFAGTGSVKIQLPGSARAAGGGTYGNLVHLQLTRNGAIIPLEGHDFIEKSLSGQTVTLDGLSPGSGYNLLISTGSKTADYYRTMYFQKSSAFEVSAGVNSNVSVTLAASRLPLLTSTAGTGTNHGQGAAVFNSKLYYLDVDGGNGHPLLRASATSDVDILTIVNATGVPNGLSVGLDGAGASVLWLNTDNGIAESNTAATSFSVPNMHDVDSVSISPEVWDSASQDVGGYDVGFYSGPGITAGLRVDDTEWSTLEGLINADQDFLDLLKGQVIRGFAIAPKYVYLSTSIATIRLDTDVLDEASNNASSLGDDLLNGSFEGETILLQAADTSLVFGPVSTYSDDDSVAFAFGGTAKGLYGGPVDALTGAPPNSQGILPLISGTQGLNITEVATGYSNGVVYTAAYSASTRELLLLSSNVNTNATTIVKRISAFEGLPNGKLKFTWFEDGDLFLIISGNDASVQLTVAEEAPQA